MHTKRVGEVENGSNVERPGSTEATLAHSSSDISENVGKRHSVVNDDGEHEHHLQGVAKKRKGLADGDILEVRCCEEK